MDLVFIIFDQSWSLKVEVARQWLLVSEDSKLFITLRELREDICIRDPYERGRIFFQGNLELTDRQLAKVDFIVLSDKSERSI